MAPGTPPPDTIPSIVRTDGTLHKTTMDLFKNGAKLSHMMAEIQAQLDLARPKGLDVRYLDGHMGFAWLYEVQGQTRVGELMARWAEKEGLIYGVKLDGGIGLRRDYNYDKIQELADRIRELKPGTYMMVGHPTYNDAEMRTTQLSGRDVGAEAENRDMERRMFMDPVIVQAFKDGGVEAIRFDQTW